MKEKTLKRGEFLKELGLSSAALMAFYCMGTTMTACSTSDDPTPTTPTNNNTVGITGNSDAAKGKIDYTLDLTNAAYAKLKTQGEFVIEGSTLVANAKGKYIALSKACTHQGTTLAYRPTQNDLWCSNHSSEFSTTGAVEMGPATKALTVYTATISTDGNKLTVKE